MEPRASVSPPRRHAVDLGAAVLVPGLAAIVFAVSVADGGYFSDEWRWTTLVLLSVSAFALLVRERLAVGRPTILALAVVSALAAWTALSALWSAHASLSILEADRDLVYLAGLLSVVLLAGAVPSSAVLAGLLAGITAVCAYALGDYLSSSRTFDPLPLLGYPIGYPNALGLLAALGVVLAVGLAGLARGRASRSAALLCLLALVPALILTQSRGSWLALAVGLAATVLVSPRSSVRRLALLSIVAAMTTAVAVAVVWSSSAKALGEVSGNNRLHYWDVAFHEFLAHPLLGSGAGTFAFYWAAHRPIPSGALDAHSLYLESLAELGPVGLALVAIFAAVTISAARRARSGTAAVATGAFVVYLVHAGFDWDFEVPAATLPGIWLAGLLVAGARERRPALTVDAPARFALVGIVVLLGGVVLARLEGAGQLW